MSCHYADVSGEGIAARTSLRNGVTRQLMGEMNVRLGITPFMICKGNITESSSNRCMHCVEQGAWKVWTYKRSATTSSG